ncbi:cytochrome P450 [Georgenia sp. AZ-5]|uniref:cytochrome P450 n=1 Tax=Georgenia sp. AZ-5 TaxID=3367526 RepID=UPI003754D147
MFSSLLAAVGYDAVRTALMDAARLSSAEGMVIPPLKSPIPLIPVELDPPEHAKYHRFLVPHFRPERVELWTDMIRETVDRIIDGFIEQGEADLVLIGRQLPPPIIAAILGVPEDGPKMVELTNWLNTAAQQGDAEGRAAANAAMFQYVDSIVTAAEHDPGRDDLLGTIVTATVDGKPLTHMAAVATVITIVIAGQETTVNGISSMLALLGKNPEARARLVEEPSLIPAAVEESVRMESPVQMIARTAVVDGELAGSSYGPGDKVGLVLGAANHDPHQFENPEEFRLDRGRVRHVGFGHGSHRCLGEHLARLEMAVVAEQVLSRLPDYIFAGRVEHWANTAFNRGVKSMPVTFTPGPKIYVD